MTLSRVKTLPQLGRRSFVKSIALGLVATALTGMQMHLAPDMAWGVANPGSLRVTRRLDWLDTRGNRIADSATGSNIILRGCAWKGYTEWKTNFSRDIDYRADLMKSYGVGVVRLSLSSGFWQFEEYRNLVDHIVDLLEKRNIYVMIDWHNDRADGSPWSKEDQVGHLRDCSLAVSWWTEITERYKQRPHVALFHLMNEPPAYVAPDGPDAEWNFMQTVGEAIHSINPNIVLSITGNPSLEICSTGLDIR